MLNMILCIDRLRQIFVLSPLRMTLSFSHETGLKAVAPSFGGLKTYTDLET